MKHTYKFITAAIIALAMTACSTGITNTAEETTSPTESVTTTAEESTSTEDKPVTADSEEAETESEETAAEEDVPAAAEDTMTAELIEELSETYTSVIADAAYNQGAMSLYGNLIDITEDGIPELVLTQAHNSGYSWSIISTDGKSLSALWDNNIVSFDDGGLFYDYPTATFVEGLYLYQNADTDGNALMYTASASYINNSKFTYVAGFVNDNKYIIVNGTMNADNTVQDIEMSVYENNAVIGTATATRPLAEQSSDSYVFGDWDDLTEAEKLYQTYFGNYKRVYDSSAEQTEGWSVYDFGGENPLVLDSGENELFNNMMAQMFYSEEYGDKYAEYALPTDTIHTVLITALENYNK